MIRLMASLLLTAAGALACSPQAHARAAAHTHHRRSPAVAASARGPENQAACLAAGAWIEARGASEDEMRAVMHVIANRRGRPGFPATACGVLLQRGQFFDLGPQMRTIRSAMAGSPKVAPAAGRREVYLVPFVSDVARRVASGEDADNTNGSLFFYCPQGRRKLGFRRPPPWARARQHTVTIGDFAFYK